MAKRLFDVVGAAGGLLVFSPVMAVLAAAILVEDGRPVFFRQVRLGRARRPFTIVKFRTDDAADGSPASAGSCARPASTNCRSSSTSCAAT